jgi:hypothetical protein
MQSPEYQLCLLHTAADILQQFLHSAADILQQFLPIAADILQHLVCLLSAPQSH